jgi:hypothetical protein
MRARLAFALIPVDLGKLVGHIAFQTISDTGKPLPRVHASQYELLTLRGGAAQEGREDPCERHIIRILQTRARGAGFVLPEIVTTQGQPGWSRMPKPPQGVLNAMRRVAGL